MRRLGLTSALLVLGGPRDTAAQSSQTIVSRLLLGDAALEIRTTEDGRLQLALADSDKVLVLTVFARDAKRWADSVALVLRARPATARVPREWTVILEEPGLAAG